VNGLNHLEAYFPISQESNLALRMIAYLVLIWLDRGLNQTGVRDDNSLLRIRDGAAQASQDV
jgi:hypothetical protein